MHRKGTAGAPRRAPPLGGSATACGSWGRGQHALAALWCLRFILSRLCLPSVAWPWGSSPEPSALLLSALSPRDRWALCCGLLHPRRAHSRRRPGPGPRPRGWLPGPGICVQDPPHFRASKEQRGPERVGFSGVPCPDAKTGEEVQPSRTGRGRVEKPCFRPAPGFGSGVGKEVRQRRWGSEESLLLSARGLGWALWSKGNL